MAKPLDSDDLLPIGNELSSESETLGPLGPMSQTEVAELLGVSQSLISQIEIRALKKMREALGGDPEDWIP